MLVFKQFLVLVVLPITIGAISPNIFANIAQPTLPIEALDSVVAVVNKSVITQSELDREVTRIQKHIERTQHITPPKQELSRQVLDKIILEKIQLQYAQMTG